MLKEKLTKVGCVMAATFCILSVCMITIFLLVKGSSAISKIGLVKFLFGTVWRPGNNEFGIFPMIIGSLYVTAFALLFGVSVGLMSSIYLAYFCPEGIYRIVKTLMDLLSGIPSIVYGLFGMVVVVPVFQRIFPGTSGKSVLTAAFILSVMILPTIITVSENALRAVEAPIYEGALALGCSKELSVMRAVLPSASSGVVSAVVLALGRVIGETMAVIMIAGNQPIIPKSILRGVRTMTANIVLEMGYATDLHRDALIATAVVLFVFIMIINLSFSALKGKAKR